MSQYYDFTDTESSSFYESYRPVLDLSGSDNSSEKKKNERGRKKRKAPTVPKQPESKPPPIATQKDSSAILSPSKPNPMEEEMLEILSRFDTKELQSIERLLLLTKMIATSQPSITQEHSVTVNASEPNLRKEKGKRSGADDYYAVLTTAEDSKSEKPESEGYIDNGNEDPADGYNDLALMQNHDSKTQQEEASGDNDLELSAKLSNSQNLDAEGESLVLSSADDIENFFREKVKDIVDTKPLDPAANPPGPTTTTTTTTTTTRLKEENTALLSVLKNRLEKVEEMRESKNWANEFQEIHGMEDSLQKFQKLTSLARDFVYAAKTYGAIIIRYVATHYISINTNFCLLSVSCIYLLI